MGWEGDYRNTSRLRGIVHGIWHYGAGVLTLNGNEFTRGNEQFSRTFRSTSPK
jgi:hypothetical protein